MVINSQLAPSGFDLLPKYYAKKHLMQKCALTVQKFIFADAIQLQQKCIAKCYNCPKDACVLCTIVHTAITFYIRKTEFDLNFLALKSHKLKQFFMICKKKDRNFLFLTQTFFNTNVRFPFLSVLLCFFLRKTFIGSNTTFCQILDFF